MAESEEGLDSQEHSWSSIVAGVMIGFVIGSATALLLAPKSGNALRGDIEETVDDLKAKTEQTMDEIQESAARLAERSRLLLEQTRENIVRSVEAGKDAYAQKKNELTAQLESQITEPVDTVEKA